MGGDKRDTRYFPKIRKLTNKEWFGDGNEDWYIQEKIDGSQCSIRKCDSGELLFHCKTTRIEPTHSCFCKAFVTLQTLKPALKTNFVYHGEVVQSKRHNVVVYERTPKYFFILYDIQDPDGNYFPHKQVQLEAERIGLECVPCLFDNSDYCEEEKLHFPAQKAKELIGKIESQELNSCLGGVPEGVVIKNPRMKKLTNYMDADGNLQQSTQVSAAKQKLVTTKFKEFQKIKKAKLVYSAEEELERLGRQFAVEGRFQKALQHLRDRNELSLKDNIAPLLVELSQDFDAENSEYVTAHLYAEFFPVVARNARSLLGYYFEHQEEMGENFPAQPTLEEVITKLELNQDVTEFLEGYGNSFISKEFYDDIISKAGIDVADNLSKDRISQKLFEIFNTEFHLANKEAITEVLYQRLNPIVKRHASFGFEEWYLERRKELLETEAMI